MPILIPKDNTSSSSSGCFQTHIYPTPKDMLACFFWTRINLLHKLIPSQRWQYSLYSSHLWRLNATWSQRWAGTSIILPKDVQEGSGLWSRCGHHPSSPHSLRCEDTGISTPLLPSVSEACPWMWPPVSVLRGRCFERYSPFLPNLFLSLQVKRDLES